MRFCRHGSFPQTPVRNIPAQPDRTLLTQRLPGAAGWPPDAYLLVGRANLAAQAATPQPDHLHSAADRPLPAATLIERLPAAGDTPAAQRLRGRGAAADDPAQAAADEAEAAPRAPPGQGGVPPYQQRLFQPGMRTQPTDADKLESSNTFGDACGPCRFHLLSEPSGSTCSQGALWCSRCGCGPRPGVG
jgi:hypothetical protein